MSVKMAIEYLESFFECDSDKSHICNVCGEPDDNQVDHSEVKKALEELKKVTQK